MNLFVAGFIGSPKMNVLPARVATMVDGAARVEFPGGARLHVPVRGAVVPPGPVVVGIRPEHIALNDGPGVSGSVTLAEHLGAETILHVAMDEGPALVARTDGRAPQRIGDRVSLSLDPRYCHLFDPSGPVRVNAGG